MRKAFRMSVHPGCEAEYARRHQPIWAELEAILRAHGVREYSIFLDPETGDLFGYAEIDDEARWNAIAETEVCRRWWASMRASVRRCRIFWATASAKTSRSMPSSAA